MKLYRNVFQIKIMCPIQLQLRSVTELWPFDRVFYVFFIIYFLVHARTYSEFCQDDGVGHKNECSSILNWKVIPPLS